ncbi:MAG: ribose 5-phosphate isomerase B [Phycisphaerae bacterium]|nr:ribose 5-phosphate isomerase B [Phycisphaerae bacterium]
MRIALGADHRGLSAAQAVVGHLRADGHEVSILGDASGSPCDYPDSAYMVASAVAEGVADRGILICGTGIGMCIAANKVRGVRAALAQDELSAQLSRTHNDANVLCLSADLLGHALVKRIVEVWFRTDFEGGRHARRLEKIRLIEEGRDPSQRNGSASFSDLESGRVDAKPPSAAPKASENRTTPRG